MSNDNNRHRAIYGLATKYFRKYARIIYKDYVGFGTGPNITKLYEWPIYLYYRLARSRAIKRSKEKDVAKSLKRLDHRLRNIQRRNSFLKAISIR